MSEWFGQTFRKLHKLYVSPQWAKAQGERFDAVKYAESLERSAVDCLELYCKDHHGTCYYPCSLGLSHPRNILGELLPELKKRNIRLIAYFSVCFDNYALGVHPEWRMVNYLGDPYKLVPFYMASVCSPYTDFALRQLDELAANYEVDGFWLDIIPLARDVKQDLWMIAPHPIPDYSLYAQRAFEAETGEQLPMQPTAEEADQIFEFMTAKVDDFLNQCYAVIRSHLPDAVITYNAAGAPGDPIDSADLISIEGHAPEYVRQSFNARWAKTRGKPFEILTAGALPRMELGGGWNGFDQKPLKFLELENAIALAHGGSMVFGQAPYPDGETDSAQFAGFADVFRPARQIEPWLREPTGLSDVGLVFAPKPRSASRLWGLMQDGAEAFHDALIDMHLQYDIIQLDRDLSRYQLLILPDQAALGDDELERLRGYVSAGGRLLASGCSSLWDENGERRSDFGLADVFGVDYERDAGCEFVYLRLADAALRSHVTALPILIDEMPLRVAPRGAEVLGDFYGPESGRSEATTILWGDAGPDEAKRFPGIVRNRYGAGQCIYIAAPLRAKGMPNAWVKRLMGVLVANLVEQPLLSTNAPAGVEVVLNQQNGRLVIHLINRYLGSPDHVAWGDDNAKLRDIEIQVDLSQAGLDGVERVYVAPDAPLEYELAAGRLNIVLPELNLQAIVAIE